MIKLSGVPTVVVKLLSVELSTGGWLSIGCLTSVLLTKLPGARLAALKLLLVMACSKLSFILRGSQAMDDLYSIVPYEPF